MINYKKPAANLRLLQSGDSSSGESPSLDLTAGQFRAGHLHESCPPDSSSVDVPPAKAACR
jgi:hypothetical protein